MNDYVIVEDYLNCVPWSDCYKSDIDSLCQRDYHRNYFNRMVVCLDVDEYEKSLSGDNDCTMDAAVGVVRYPNNNYSTAEILLIELRLDVKSINNLKFSKLHEKIKHTKELLSGSIIEKEYLFVYSENVYNRVQSEFSRKKQECKDMESWCVITPRIFVDKISHSIIQQNYEPINNIDDIISDLDISQNKGYPCFYEHFNKWLTKADSYRSNCNVTEAASILEAVKTAIESICFTDQNVENNIRFFTNSVYRKLAKCQCYLNR